MKKVIAAGGLVFNDRRELLMIYRYEKWDLPKGHFEKGETLEQCALREVSEETGLRDLRITRFIGVTEHTYYDERLSSDAVKEVHWFAMHSGGGDLVPLQEEGIERIHWVGREDLARYLANSYDNIREIIGKALASDA